MGMKEDVWSMEYEKLSHITEIRWIRKISESNKKRAKMLDSRF